MSIEETAQSLGTCGRDACNSWIDDVAQSLQEGDDAKIIASKLMGVLSTDEFNVPFENARYSQEAILRIHRIACEGAAKGLQANEGKLGGDR